MSKPTDAWMPLYIGDYLADTQHLTYGEHGVYMLLIMAYWRNGGALPDDDRSFRMITKASPEQWKKLRPRVSVFFDLSDGENWRHKRIDAELLKATETVEKRREAGKIAAKARWRNGEDKACETHTDRNADAMRGTMRFDAPAPSPSPSPSPKGSVATPEPTYKNLTSEPFAARATDENQGFLRKFEEVQGGRYAPLDAAIVRNKRDHLVQKLVRYSQATLAEPHLSAAVGGLCGADPNHDDQWWLDHLDKKMRDEHWDDAERISA